jgi:hypothetical protein
MNQSQALTDVQALLKLEQSKLQELHGLFAAPRNSVVQWKGQAYTYRGLQDAEIQALGASGCQAPDGWHQVALLVPSHNRRVLATELSRLVSSTSFGSDVILILPHDDSNGSSASKDSSSALPKALQVLPRGCHGNTHVSEAVLHLAGKCIQNQVVQGILVEADACLSGCASVTTCPEAVGSPLGPIHIQVGPESGGRRALYLPAYATMLEVTQQLRHPLTKTGNEQPSLPYASWNMLMEGSYIRNTPTVESVVLHTTAKIVAATAVTCCLLYPQAGILHQSVVTNCRLQWKATIVNHSTVENSLLMEYSGAGPSSFCANAILGPDVHISAGEVHASILGPNTNAHHQSLVIGVLWPTGRGNVGYGSNVGSNHTGRLPDQECAAGEGTFFGLASIISFPLNLAESPYSLIAAGTQLNAQRVSMPFSLLQTGTIAPGWVWSKSPYTVVRSADKYARRRKAVHHAYYTGWEIFRPQLIRQCVAARQALRDCDTKNATTHPAMGKLQCSPKGRQLGIEAYTDCIRLFALRELLKQMTRGEAAKETPEHLVKRIAMDLEYAAQQVATAPSPASSSNVTWPSFPWEDNVTEKRSYCHQLLVQEFPVASSWKHWLVMALSELLQREQALAKAVRTSKSRDDTRGEATIPDYGAAHVAVEDDPVIQNVEGQLLTTTQTIQSVLQHLNTSTL